MNTDRLEALLWARIDGTIEPEELAELEAHLAEHPGTREIERQIATIAEGLDALDRVPPPSELRERIDSALALAAPPAALTEHSTATPHTHPTPAWPVRWLPVAASLLIGIAVGYLLHPGTSGSIDQSEVTGAMLTPPAQTARAPVEIHLEAGAGSVTASRTGAEVVIDVLLTDEIDVTVTIAGAGGPVRLGNLSSSVGATTEVTTEHGWVVVRTSGPGTMTLSISAMDADDPLLLQVSSDGLPADERWIGSSRNEIEP
jgi:anti-sigma factor RsiW